MRSSFSVRFLRRIEPIVGKAGLEFLLSCLGRKVFLPLFALARRSRFHILLGFQDHNLGTAGPPPHKAVSHSLKK